MNQPEHFYRNLLDHVCDGVYFVDLNRTITYWNKGAEQITGYSSAEVAGSSCSGNILVHVDDRGKCLCTDTCPLLQSTRNGMDSQLNVFLHHRDGRRVPVTVKASPIRDESGSIIGAVEIFHTTAASINDSDYMEELRKAALIDPLTEIGNRRYLEMKLKTSCEELQRYGVSFGVIMADIDFFKKVNDTYGHQAGDSVLKMVAGTLSSNVRTCDLVGRWGGEEFMTVVTHVDAHVLASLSEKLRMLVERSFVNVDGEDVRVTISLGAVVALPDETVEAVVKRADSLLYSAKKSGRNRVAMENF
jgi:diguanylate cyclase (GGDEF)-like protein/PAS domain S-box-containing protein